MKIGTKRLSENAEKLFSLIPADGGFIGNTSLQRSSQLGEDYWNVRRELLDTGRIILGKGRGGSVAKRPLESVSEVEAEIVAEQGAGLVADESDLYIPLKQWLEKNWGREVQEAGDFFSAKITATARGRQRASGQWSRPDLTVVQVNKQLRIPTASQPRTHDIRSQTICGRAKHRFCVRSGSSLAMGAPRVSCNRGAGSRFRILHEIRLRDRAI